ncbi:MAG: PD-(D/E)XK nuclease family protein [Oscillospiraceae bacterium]|nr:PD-(D/E)XK nuclease family protein [Oscillospiraceae bacterium]
MDLLRIIRGPDHKVNTDALLRRLLDAIAAGEDGLILLVPEQYSFEAERTLCRLGGDTVSRCAEVLSFSRLADRVECACGGAANRWLDRGGRLLAAAQAVDQVLSRIKLYAGVCKKTEFLEQLLLAIDEFGNYNVTPEALRLASARESGQFAQKLEELSLLLESYHAVCTQAHDPSLRLKNLAETLSREDFAEGRSVFVNGFTDFTALEQQIVEQLILSADSVTIALPHETSCGAEVFPSAANTARALKSFCAAANVPVETETLGFDESVPPDLLLAQKNVSQAKPAPACGKTPNVVCMRAADRDGMCRAAVRRVRALLREGARCRDIAIACQSDGTLPVLEAALRRAELPYFVSGREPVTEHGGARAVLTALRCVTSDLARDDVIDYLRSGVTPLSADACDRLENYAILWNIGGAMWTHEWTDHPRELSDVFTDRDTALLAELNQWRETAVTPLLKLKSAVSQAKTVGAMTAAVTAFLHDSGFFEQMQSYADAFYASGEFLLAQQYAQICEILLGALGQMDLILRDCVRTPDEFCRLLEKLIAGCTIGAIPAAADQLSVGTAANLRGRAVPHLMILDADDGHFPSSAPQSGVFTEAERAKLLSGGLTLAPDRADAMERELGGLYQTVRSATRSLALYCADTAPSFLTRRIAGGGDLPGADDALMPLSAAEAASVLLQSDLASSDASLAPCLRELEKRRGYTFGALSEQTVRRLYGDEFRLSASQVDVFTGCRFAYFLKYGINAKPRGEIRFDASQFGTFVHDVLENTVREVMARGGFHTVPLDDVLAIAETCADVYADRELAALKTKDERFAGTFSRNRAETLAIVRDLAEELRVSDFEPAYCELHFDDGGDLPAIRTEGGRGVCKVRGYVDRVDLYRGGGRTFVRVVDYKTGKKDFDYAEITKGHGMQMLIYLFALHRGGETLIGAVPEPAGVLYMPARQDTASLKKRPTADEAKREQIKAHRRKGLIRESDDLIAAMERYEDSPQYLPITKKTRNTATGEQFALLERYVFDKLRQIADGIASGDVMPDPIIRGEKGSCTYCDFRDVCQKDFAKINERPLHTIGVAAFFEELTKWEEEHGKK